MSWGSLIGAVAGGVIGFILGGPIGAYYGASLGFAIGMYVDPITPDVTPVGAPDTSELVMSGEVGTPVYDLAGTGKIIGHLLCYGGEHAEAEEEEIETGKGGGGSETYVTGYKYYMSWAVGIAVGQVDTLLAIYENDDVVWEGELACPASGGQETITLDGMGSATFYFGTNDQALNSKVGAIIDDASLNIPYRNLCWCFLDDCYIGNYNRTPSLSFIVKKIPQYVFSGEHAVGAYDCNPAHLMWYILHDLAGLSESWLHTADFTEVAATLKSESRGLSVAFSAQQSAIGYLESINNHIDSILRYGIDGKFHPKLLRDDYVAEDLPLIDEEVMIEEPVLKRKSWIDTVNEMKVQYTYITEQQVGELWGAGFNHWGSLGLGSAAFYYGVFTEIDIEKYVRISCGIGHHSFAICRTGELWGTGHNQMGQLGIGSTDNLFYFTLIDDGSWLDVVGGYDHSLFLKSDGALWIAGANVKGQLGLGDNDSRLTLTHCIDNVAALGTGMYYSVIVMTNGTIRGAGSNGSYQLGLDDNIDKNVFTQEALGDVDWASVAGSSGGHTMALKVGGGIYGVGGNYYGQLGLGYFGGASVTVFTHETRSYLWKKVSCLANSTIALKMDGTIWGTGHNSNYDLGLGDTSHRCSFTQIGSDNDWIDVNCGVGSVIATKSDWSLWGWGHNAGYELGLGHDDPVQTPTQLSLKAYQVKLGQEHTIVVKRP